MSSPSTIHLHPTAELAERVLLPGDPGRALELAQVLLERPLMFNHNRGLWGYTGIAPDGELLSIQSTGMGGPSAAIVLEELIMLGVKRAIRVGTAGALSQDLSLGELLIATEAISQDGTSGVLSESERTIANPGLSSSLKHAAVKLADCSESFPAVHNDVTVVSTDLFYEPAPSREHDWSSAGAVAVEMEAATLFAIGARTGVPVGCLLAISDILSPNGARRRIATEDLKVAERALGELAAEALGA